MNIAMVTDTYRPRISGVVTAIDAYAGEFRRMGHRVLILAPEYPGAGSEPDVVRFPSHYVFFDPEDRLANPWLPVSRRLARVLDDVPIDVFHTHTPFTLGLAALAWARRREVPVVHTCHTFFAKYVSWYLPFVPAWLGENLAASLSRGYCNRCSLVVAPSASMRDALLGYGVVSPIEVSPTGIDTRPLVGGDGHAFRGRHGFDKKERLLLYMGRVAHEKNIGFLLRVVAILRKELDGIRLLVSGDGPARPYLRKQARRMGLEGNVRFLGYLTGGEWANCYSAAEVFVFASETESQGLVLSEARAAGTPVVAVGAMGVCESMGSATPGEAAGGTIVRADEAEFAGAVGRYLQDERYMWRKRKEALRPDSIPGLASSAARMLEFYSRVTGRQFTPGAVLARA